MAISYGTITITDLGSVTKVDVYYYVSTSATKLSGGSWSTDAPVWSDNKYIWSKTVTTWEEGRTTESNPACITGAKGTTGQSGRSIQSIKEQYYLSTSSTSQVGGSWQDAMPTYVNGRYYWTHSIITWKEPNGSTTTETTTAILAGALTSANSTAKSASDTATAANNTANAANNTANAANDTAGEAKSIAQEAQSTAGQALTAANNKNKTFYQDSQPTGGSYLDGDSWYDTNDDNKLYIYNGTSKKWVAQQFGNAAIADSSITNAKIANATIQSAKIVSLEGAKIVANSITSNKLATDAIKSNNYQASPNTSSPYSATGTFLDLSTGNIYTPNFGVDSVNGAAHINGQVIATSGQIGDSSTNYWQIGTYNDYNMNPSAAIIGNGTSYIQSGTWQISNNRINTQTYDGNNQITYMHYGSKYWDYGMKVPELDSTKSTYINGVSNNWLYIRRSPTDTIPSLETDWEYLFRVDKDGTVYENGVKLSEKYASIDGVSGAYLPRSGGTITGNLTVNGTLTATASKANALTHTLTINGQSWSGSANLTINTLGVAYGGTGKTTGKDAANYFLNSLDTGSSTPVDGDYYISQYVGGGTTTTTYHRRPMSALWLYVKSKLSAADMYVPKTGGTFTGAVHVEDEFYGDSATLGNLIVNGNANFINGLRATTLNGGQAIYPVKGTQTSKTGNWTGNINVSALYDGLTIAYWLPYAPDGNASLNLTLNNGTTTGAINCYYSGTSRLTTHYGAGNTILLTYWSNANINGSSYTGWWAHSQYYSYDIVQQGINYAQFQADTGGIQNYSLFLRTSNNKYASIVTSAGTGTKTKSTLAFDLSRLYLYYCNNAIALDGYTSTWYVKTSYPLADMRYSFNITSNAGLVGKKPVYLVFNAAQTGNGYHTLADNWWTQDLPTSVDNKLYMYLGMAYDWYRMDLELNHPIYYFENGSIQTYYDGYFAGRLSSSQITTALGYTPYNATNPNGYTTNKGTVTSVAASGSGGISISGSPITTSGTIGIGLNLSTAINGLGEGTSPANRNDYIVAQYAGGGTTTTTYHRRKLSNIFAALAAEDIPSLPWSKISSGNDDLKAIEALTGTSGFLKKTAANTWTLDTNTYLTTHQTVTDKNATLAWGAATTVATIGSTNINVSLPSNPNNHYTANLITGASNSAKANAAATNGNVFLNLIENNTVRNYHNLKGGNGLTVTSDANGVVTFTSPAAFTGVSFGDGKLTFSKSDGNTAEILTDDFVITQATGATGLVNSSGQGLNVGGATTKPVYFKNGIPTEITSIPYTLLTDAPTSMTPTAHTHGNIQNGGTLQTSDITVGNGDKIVVTDSSNSHKVARSSIAFDGSTKTQALTKAGTWETFNNYSLPLAANGTRGGVKIGYTSSGKNYAVQLSDEKMYVNVPWTDTTYSAGTGLSLSGTTFSNSGVRSISTGNTNGTINVNTNGTNSDIAVKGLGSAAFVNTSLFPIVSTYVLPAAKAVRIQYPLQKPVLISAQCSNSGGRLILLGGGYGAGGTIRNDFQELVSSNINAFTWTIPSSDSISNSIEIMNVSTSGAADITVWSSSAATFTEIEALSDDAMNRKIITSMNYTDYTVTKTGTGASGSWGINITGNATTATSATKATQDSDGNQINTTYLKLAGGTMTGVLNMKANQFEDSYFGALNMNNSNIYGVNSIYTADASDNSQEGIHFYRSATTVDSLHAQSGVLYFTPNRPLGSTGTSYSIYHTGNKPTKSDVGLGNVDNTADANKVVKGVSAIAGSADTYRHVWFSDTNPETSRNYDDDFKYNPNKNVLQVKNITGDSIQLTNWKIEEDSSTNSLMFRYVG